MRWALLALLALGCSKKPEPETTSTASAVERPGAVVTKVTVEDLTPSDLRPVKLDREALMGALAGALTAAGLPRAEAAPGTAWRVEVRARVAYGIATPEGLAQTLQPGDAKVHWQIELRVRAPETPEAMYSYIESDAESAFDGDEAALKKALEAHAVGALTPAAQRIAKRVGALRADVSGLIAQLEDADPDVRHASASRLGMLRAADAVPALAERLPKEADRDVQMRMVGALAEIGDDRAAMALIGLADPRDRELLRAVVDALSVVGGKRVSDFLDMLSTHDAADIREMVQTARRRLKDRPEVAEKK